MIHSDEAVLGRAGAADLPVPGSTLARVEDVLKSQRMRITKNVSFFVLKRMFRRLASHNCGNAQDPVSTDCPQTSGQRSMSCSRSSTTRVTT